MKKALIIIVIFALLCVLIPGCRALTSDTGTYKFDSMISNGYEIQEGDEFFGAKISESYVILKIDSDGTYTLSGAGSFNSKGKWSNSGSTIVLKANNGAEVHATRSGCKITIEAGSNKIVLKKSIFSY